MPARFLANRRAAPEPDAGADVSFFEKKSLHCSAFFEMMYSDKEGNAGWV